MKKFPSVQTLLNSSEKALRRFPLAMAMAFAASMIGLYMTENPHFTDHMDTLVSVAMSMIFGFPLMISIVLAGERGKWSKNKSLITDAGGLLLVLAYYLWILPGGDPDLWTELQFIVILILNISAYLTLTFAPFIGRKENLGFWQYNRRMVKQFALTTLSAMVLFAGVSLMLFTIDELFDIRVKEELYVQSWILITGILSPLIFFAGTPKKIAELNHDKAIPKVVKNFGQYILIPLITVYAAILYAYAAQILITTAWPMGIISGLIIGFATVAILTLLIIHPFNTIKGNEWIVKYTRWFYILLLPLTLMLFIAIGIRIGEYGVTESRYYVVLLGVWLAGISLYAIVNKNKDLKMIPLSVSVILLFSIWGPWSSFHVSQYSQTNRLEATLTEYGVLQDEKIVKKVTETNMGNEELSNVRSMVSYLGRHGFKSIDYLFEDDIAQYDELTKNGKKAEILKALGLATGKGYSDTYTTSYYTIRKEEESSIQIGGHDLLVEFENQNFGNVAFHTHSIESNGETYELRTTNHSIRLFDGKREILSAEFHDFAKELSRDRTYSTEDLIIQGVDGQSEYGKIMVVFDNITIKESTRTQTPERSINSYEVTVFLSIK
jgi:hypothetical protein